MRFLLLRPDNKIAHSCSSLLALGVDVVGMPLLKIVADEQAVNQLPTTLAAIETTSIVIFTSGQAVELAKNHLDNLATSIQVWAIGETTCERLGHFNVQARVPKRQNSEGLIAELPTCLTGCTVYLFKGHGGRTLLPEKLRESGATVLEINLYKRNKNLHPEPIGDWNDEHIQGIIATSGELVEAAFSYFEPAWLISKKWIVVSERIAKIVKNLGIKDVLVSSGACDKAIAACIHASLEQ